jgi:hypothetical protein
MKEWILNINDHTYAGDRIYVDSCLNVGRDDMKGKHAIIGVEKGNVVILLSEPYRTETKMNVAMAKYIQEGFKVYHT